MNQTVTVTYNLSAVGQKAALLAGRTATQVVTETMTLEDAALLDHVSISAAGELIFDTSKQYNAPNNWEGERLVFDAPPADLPALVTAYQELKGRVAATAAEKEAKRKAAAEAEQQAQREKLERDMPIVEAILSELEAMEPGSEWPTGLQANYYELRKDGYQLSLTDAQIERKKAILESWDQARKETEAAAAKAEQDSIDAIVAEYGGYMWKLEAGYCTFTGYDLWQTGQSRRWVGTFSKAKGIDNFLDSPRGEHTFDVRILGVGDCIQGGGYSERSRGRRKNESEFFGVVISAEFDRLVVKICGSRAAALAAAKTVSVSAF